MKKELCRDKAHPIKLKIGIERSLKATLKAQSRERVSDSRKAAFCATFSKKVAKQYSSLSFLFTKKRNKRKSSLRESHAAPGFGPPQRLSRHA
ncbi:hypothetical protein [Sulfurimonas diazotrophicus]|uniref:Uncharacterized protein n=1 Tax=Sulfurimonas diazotrophicus TaxID=3131939 RepID=A0ABZ3H8K4_9BACT